MVNDGRGEPVVTDEIKLMRKDTKAVFLSVTTDASNHSYVLITKSKIRGELASTSLIKRVPVISGSDNALVLGNDVF